MVGNRNTASVLGTGIDVTNHGATCDRIFHLASQRRAAYVCFATAHMLVEATRDLAIKEAYRNADVVSPDGTPVAWCVRLMGNSTAECVSGPRIVPKLLQEAEIRGVRVGFYGGRPETLRQMIEVLSRRFPRLEVRYTYSPPFRQLSMREHEEVMDAINASSVQLLFVGLGSPKQELWMRRSIPFLHCTCLGVGAAFEFLSGEKVMPPLWLQHLGLTWLVRLCQEPRRLARRNLYSPVFVAMFLRQCITRFRVRPTSTNRPVAGAQPE